jgi:two-component system NtrC family sensor kinase
MMNLYQNLTNEINILQIDSLTKPINEIALLNNEKKVSSLLLDSNNLIAESIDGLLRIKKIVANIKIFSAEENTELNAVNINDCINSALEIVGHELKYAFEVVKDLSELPIIVGSQNQLMLVFVNLILNAIQACSGGGKIIITTKSSKSNILVTISDNGCGIAPENISKIFTPFFTTKPAGAESGLGLASAYAIIQSHKGKITVESTLGSGSKFTIELPL